MWRRMCPRRGPEQLRQRVQRLPNSAGGNRNLRRDLVRSLLSGGQDPVQWRLHRTRHRLLGHMSDGNEFLPRALLVEWRCDWLWFVVHGVPGSGRGIAGDVRRYQVWIPLQQRLPLVQ